MVQPWGILLSGEVAGQGTCSKHPHFALVSRVVTIVFFEDRAPCV